MKTKLFIVSAALLLAAFLAGAAPQSGKPTDSMVQSMVEHRLAQKGLSVNNNIQVSVADNAITLTGEAQTLAVKKRSEQEVKKVEEDYTVINRLSVKYARVPDSKLAETVQNKINAYMFYTLFDWVTVEAHDGVITLKGSVYQPWTAKQIEAQVDKIENVQKVDNQIQFIIGSDELRYRAARVIYTDFRFEPYVYFQNPPVHILVEGPNVILEGTVRAESDKNWAETLVEFNTDVFRVINNLKVAEK